MMIGNALPATTSPKRGVTVAPPFDRPAVTVTVETEGSRLDVPGRALAWTDTAVHVEVTIRGAIHLVWVAASDVRKR